MPVLAQLLQTPEAQNYMSAHPNALSSMFKEVGLLTPQSQGITMMPTPGTMQSGLPYQAGDMLGSVIEDKQLLKPLGSYLSNLGYRHGMSALGAGLGGGALGAGYGWLTGRDPLLWGGLGAGLGAAGGYGLSGLIEYLNQQRRERRLRHEADMKKYSFYVSGGDDPETYIQSRLFEDQAMSVPAKSQMLMQIQQLPSDQLLTLANLLRSSVGASVGYLIGRFLLNLGGTGRGISAGIGGLLGVILGRGSSLPKNVYGQEVDTRFDPFGNRRFVS